MAPGDDQELEGDVDTQTPEGTEEQTPEETLTLTRKEHESILAKAVNDARTDVGRLTAEIRRSQEIANAAIGRLQEREENDYRRQEEAAEDNPDELTQIRQRRQNTIRAAELAEEKTKVKAQLATISRIFAKSLAAQYNASEETLLKYASDDMEKMEELAKSYGERKTSGDTNKSQQKRMTQAPDDGKTKEGSRGLTLKDVRGMSLEEQNRRRSEIAKIPFG